MVATLSPSVEGCGLAAVSSTGEDWAEGRVPLPLLYLGCRSLPCTEAYAPLPTPGL